jgi:hypothetical protein
MHSMRPDHTDLDQESRAELLEVSDFVREGMTALHTAMMKRGGMLQVEFSPGSLDPDQSGDRQYH